MSQILGKDEREIGLKLENVRFLRDVRGNFSSLSLEHTDAPHFIFLTQNNSLKSKIRAKK